MTLSLDSLAAIAEVVGAIAVVLSLIYVGHQVKQNTKALRTQVHETLVGHVFAAEGTLLANADLARIIIKSSSVSESLTPDERLRADKYFTFEFVNWESAYLHYKQGFIEEQVWRRWDMSSYPDKEEQGYFEFWAKHRDWYDSSFANHVDRVFINIGYTEAIPEGSRNLENR
ncbi:hypothetical protein ACFL1V_06670 [Pseudomonadota bacterium]